MDEGSLTVDDLVAAVTGSEDLALAVAQLSVRAAQAQDPRLGEAIRASAVARYVDAGVLGALRADPDSSVNEHLLGLMRSQGLVEDRAGRLVFHDVTRNALLREWQASEESRARFAELNRRLVDYYLAALADAMALSEDFAPLSLAVRSANSERWARLRAAIEFRVSSAVRGAAYHGFRISVDEGMALVRGHFEQLMADERVDAADRLITESTSFLRRLPHDDVAGDLAVLRYLASRVARSRTGRTEAIEVLEPLVEDPHLPGRYRLWAIDDLSTVYEERLQLDRALALRKQLGDGIQAEDPWNAPLWVHHLGRLQWRLLDFPGAVTSFEKALQLAEVEGCRTDLRVLSRICLSQVRYELGDVDGATIDAFEALDLARTEHLTQPTPQQQVGAWLACFVLPVDAVAADAALAECTGLHPAGSPELIDVLTDRRWMLLELGATVRLRRTDAELIALMESHRAEREPGEPSNARGVAAASNGAYRPALAQFTECLAEVGGASEPSQLLVNALLSRSRAHLRLGEWDEAERDLAQAREALLAAGWQRRAIWADLEWVRLDLARGRLRDGADRLASLADPVRTLGGGAVAEHLRLTGELHLARAEWHQAEESLVAAAELRQRRREPYMAVETLRHLMPSAEERIDWAAEQRVLSRLHKLVRRLAGEAEYLPHGSTLDAIAVNADGMRQLTQPGKDARLALQAARNRFESAERRNPSCFLHPLNLAYVLGAQQRWDQARAAVAQALEVCPPLLRAPALHRRLLEYAQEEVLQCSPGGLADSGGAYLATVEEHVRHVAPEQRRRLAATGVLVAAAAGIPAAVVRMASLMGRAPTDGASEMQEAVSRCIRFLPDAAAHWSVLQQIERISRQAPRSAAANLGVLAEELHDALASWFGLDAAAGEPGNPWVLPLVLEVGAAVTPLVDDAQDKGRFLFELVPDMRARVRRDTGVELPSLRARGSFALPPDGVRLLVDEVEVLSATAAAVATEGFLEPFDPHRHTGDQLFGRHPLSDEPGPWALVAATDGPAVTVLDAAQTLLLWLERQLLDHLDVLCGVDEVAAMVHSWAQDPSAADEVHRLLPDDEARLRLAWVVQRLLRDGAPLRRDAILAGLDEAGGAQADPGVIEEAVRDRLGLALPGREPGRVRWTLPPQFFAQALEGTGPDAYEARQELRRWLRARLKEHGPWATLVVPDGTERRAVTALVRDEEPAIAVVTEHEARTP